MKFDDPRWVATQYQDSSNFDARVRIYELFDVSSERWMPFMFNCMRLRAGERVLEVGCGTGNLWRDNAQRLPDVSLTLTDLSPGMLGQAHARLTALPVTPEFRIADVQSLPFADASFDVAISNSMLYHVPDRETAVRELERVLRPGGRVHVSTYPWTHLIELRELVTRFGMPDAMLPMGRVPDEFDVENAVEEIARWLRIERVERRDSALAVTDVGVLLDFVSSAGRALVSDESLERLRAHVTRQIELCGALRIQIAAAVVTASKR